jgi:hypothetical protein
MMQRHRSILACVVLVFTAACGSREPEQPAVAEPSVSFSRERLALGSPVDVTYRFKVAADARLDQDYLVMAHFLDADGKLMWTDDHQPPTPTSEWRPGQVVEYTRTVFLPVYQYVGRATFNVGLYSPKDGRRLTLSGDDRGQHSYRVASLELLPQTENVFVIFKSGWHPKEVASKDSPVSWQWTRKVATASFRNPRRDSVLYIHLDNPGKAFREPQRIDVAVNGEPVESFELPPDQELIHRTRLTAAQLGSADIAEVQLQIDKTHVPALLPASTSRDARELGVRVFHLFVEPERP